MQKNCVVCNKSYTTKSNKGALKAKYCAECKVIQHKIQVKISTKKSELKKQIKKGYILPNEDDLIFYGYKNPLKRVKEGFGFDGVVRYSKDAQKIQCHICGKLFKNVGSHSKFAHKISADEYKKKFNLSASTALVGEATRLKMIHAHDGVEAGFSNIGKTKEEISAHMKKMSLLAKNKGKKGWSLERRNEEGNCPDQLIARIKKLGRKLGRRPSSVDYQKEYGSFSSVITVYGTWNNAIKIAGYTSYNTEKEMKIDRGLLLQQMRHFYRMHNRTPRHSDMKRGLLPNPQNYITVFGNLNKARQEAGVPVLIKVSKYRYDEVSL